MKSSATLKLNRQIVIVPEDSGYKAKKGELVYKFRLTECSQCHYLKCRPCWCEAEGQTLDDMLPVTCNVCKGHTTPEQEKEFIRKDPSLAYDGWESAYLGKC